MKLVKTATSFVRSMVFAILLSAFGLSALSLLKVNGSSASADELIGTTDYNYDIVANIDGSGASGNIAKTSDGSLRVFGLKSNTADLEQRFDRIKLTSGYYQIRSRSNNQCLRVLNPVRGGEISMGSCDPNDSTNQFYSGWFENQFGDIRPRNNQNGCFQFTDYANPARLILWDCNGSPYQVLRHYDDRGGLIVQAQATIVQTRTIQSSRYETWLVGRNFSGSIPGLGNLGHAFVAVIQFKTIVQQRLDGMIWVDISTQNTDVISINTLSRWPNIWSGNNYNNSSDMEDTRQLITKGRVADGSVFAVRKAWITSSLSDRIFSDLKNNTGCPEQYGTFCVCTSYSSRLWLSITGEQIELPTPPNGAVDRINAWDNAFGQFAGSGKLFN